MHTDICSFSAQALIASNVAGYVGKCLCTKWLLRYFLRRLIIFNRFRRGANATESERVKRQADFPGLNKKTKMTNHKYILVTIFSHKLSIFRRPQVWPKEVRVTSLLRSKPSVVCPQFLAWFMFPLQYFIWQYPRIMATSQGGCLRIKGWNRNTLLGQQQQWEGKNLFFYFLCHKWRKERHCNIAMGMWDGFLRKRMHSFGHYPNYHPTPLLPQFGHLFNFFWRWNSRFASQFKTKILYILFIDNITNSLNAENREMPERMHFFLKRPSLTQNNFKHVTPFHVHYTSIAIIYILAHSAQVYSYKVAGTPSI